ncbi:mRNA cap-binding protein [Balamuthia mandrillaris]
MADQKDDKRRLGEEQDGEENQHAEEEEHEEHEAEREEGAEEGDEEENDLPQQPRKEPKRVKTAEERAAKKAARLKRIQDLGLHPLRHNYSFWFVKRSGARSQESYEKNMKKLGSFSTVEDFWSHYNHMCRPNDLPNTSDYNLFRKGVKPMWEDDANKRGGKWIIRLKKGLASKYWEDLVLAVVGEQFQVGSELCGIVISIRFQEDILSVWNRNADNKAAKLKIYETLKDVLELPPNTVMEYKCHDASIKDNSSFRNTDVYR